MLFPELVKCFADILKNQENNEENSLISVLHDIGYYTILSSIKLYSMYNNPYVGEDEENDYITDFTLGECKDNLFIFNYNDRLINNINHDDFKNIMIDIIDHEWEDYNYNDIKHFSEVETNEDIWIKDLNCLLYAIITKTKYFNIDNSTEMQIILEELKKIPNELRLLIGYKTNLYHVATIKLKKIKNRRKQIFSIIEELISNIILALKTFELTILEIRKTDENYKFNYNDEYFYQVLQTYIDESSKQYNWVMDVNKSIHTSNYKKLVKDLLSNDYSITNDLAIINDKYIGKERFDECIDDIVRNFEQIECVYNNEKFNLKMPINIRNNIKSIISYQYEDNKYYIMNIGATEIFNKIDEKVIKFPMILLMDQDNNIINQEDIKDYNIANCYNELISWLTEELEKAGIPDEIINIGSDSFIESTLQNLDNLEKKEIAEKLNIKGNVILLDGNSNSIGDVLNNISSLIDQMYSPDISNLSFDTSTIFDNKQITNNKYSDKFKLNNVSVSNIIPFEDPIQYGEYIRNKLLPYLRSIKIQFCMNSKDLKGISDCFKEFSNMNELEYYDENNIFSSIEYNQLFQNSSFIVNINYKDILLDSLYVWYSESDDEFFIGRIFDKINYSIPKVKEWFKQGCKFNISGGLNLNLCSYTGIANIDLTGLSDYVFDRKISKHNLIKTITILDNSNKRFKDRKIFEISSYIWSVISNIFAEEYIRDINYRGEDQERIELKYLKYSDNYTISQMIDDFDELIKENYLDYSNILNLIIMTKIGLNKDDNATKDIDNFNGNILSIKFPDGNTFGYDPSSSVKIYYRIKPKEKILNRKFYANNKYINEFNIKNNTYEKTNHLILIKNIKDSHQFMEDLLSVLKYFKYTLENKSGD